MKLKLTTLALTAVVTTGMAHALQTPKAPAKPEAKPQVATKGLKAGDLAPALKDITWLQGSEVKNLNEKGKLYIVECWATWCGPCIAIIPHMNELHKKYEDKGLVIVGMNVFEEGVDKAKNFLKEQGDEMSYRVAYSGGNGADFSQAWLNAAGVRSIPTAYVVKDGKILFIGHPSVLEEEVIESMMSSDFDLVKFEKEQKELAEKRQQLEIKLGNLYKARDWKAMKELAMTNELTKGESYGASIISRANAMLNDWASQLVLLNQIKEGKFGKHTKPTQLIGGSIAGADSVPGVITLAKALAPLYEAEKPNDKNYFGRIAHARTLFLVGNTAEATKELEALKTSVSKLKGQPGVEQFIKKIDTSLEALKEGKFPPFG